MLGSVAYYYHYYFYYHFTFFLCFASPEQDWLGEANGPQRSVSGQKRSHHRGRQQVLLCLHFPAERQAGHQVW